MVVASHPPFVCVQSLGGDSPCPWPYRHTIRARILNPVHPVLESIIKSTADDWLSQHPSKDIGVSWVTDNGPSDVRISVGEGISRCAVGARARDIPSDKPTAVLGWSALGSEQRVWDYGDMRRAARHMWGHIFGLPHARSPRQFALQSERIKQLCDNAGVPTSQLMNLSGSPDLSSRVSIMHFDRPSEILGSSDAKPFSNDGTNEIDPESIAMLIALYPTAKEVLVTRCSVTDMKGWKGAGWTNQQTYQLWNRTRFTSSHVCALSLLDLGMHGNYVAQALVGNKTNDGFLFRIGSWQTESHIIDIRANFLSFLPDDQRVQVGNISMAEAFRGNDTNNCIEGETREKRLLFSRPWAEVPEVVCFIYRFKSDSQRWVRMKVFVDQIDREGFTIHLNSWANSLPYDIGAWWIAHAANDPTIRSGQWLGPDHGNGWVRRDSSFISYSSPMITKPRAMFVGLNHVNMSGGHNHRIACDVNRYDHQGVEIEITSWQEENKWHQVGASYIAFL